jgi:hypothetical protein
MPGTWKDSVACMGSRVSRRNTFSLAIYIKNMALKINNLDIYTGTMFRSIFVNLAEHSKFCVMERSQMPQVAEFVLH